MLLNFKVLFLLSKDIMKTLDLALFQIELLLDFVDARLVLLQ